MKNNDKIREAVLYLVFGVLTTIINYLVLFVMKKSGFTATDLGFTLSNGLAWIIAVIFAYVTNRVYVFRSDTSGFVEISKEASKFLSGRIFTGLFEIILPTPLAKLINNELNLSFAGFYITLDEQWLAKIIVSVLIIIMNFVISKFLVFKKAADEINAEENDGTDVFKHS